MLLVIFALPWRTLRSSASWLTISSMMVDAGGHEAKRSIAIRAQPQLALIHHHAACQTVELSGAWNCSFHQASFEANDHSVDSSEVLGKSSYGVTVMRECLGSIFAFNVFLCQDRGF
jgi:hypothetical protein